MNPTPNKGLLASIVHAALQHKYLVLFFAHILIIWGIFDLGKARYDVFPEFAPPQVVIQTESPGLAPEAVETLVTQPLENALNGIEGLASLRSSSIQGLSVITATFNAGSDIYRDRQIVAERLANTSNQLPMGVNPPAMTPLTCSTSTVLIVGLTLKFQRLEGFQPENSNQIASSGQMVVSVNVIQSASN
jgi:Cu/Ag efflux pump CusA